MRLGWPLRFAILIACLLPVALAMGCGFAQFVLPWGPAGHALGSWVAPCTAISPLLGGQPQEMEIVPPWYLLPLYAILRSVPWKLAGVIVAGAAFLAPLSLGFFDWDKVPARAWAVLLAVLVPCVYALGYLGAQEATEGTMRAGQVLTLIYFAAFLVIFPLLARPWQRVA